MKIRTIAITAITAIALTGCGSAVDAAIQAADPWQDDLRFYLDEYTGTLSNTEVGEMCLGLAFLDLDTPGEIGSAVLAFDEAGELPPANMTVGEWAESEGQSLPYNLPEDLTVREVADEAGAYFLDLCGTDY